MPDQTCRFLDLRARDPANCFDLFRRIAPAEAGIELEDRVANHLAPRGHNSVFALERKIGAVITPGGSIVRHRPRCGAVPGEGAARISRRCEILLGQQTAGVGAHQQRPVAPIADEIAIVPAALDHDIGDAEGEGAVGARTHPEP